MLLGCVYRYHRAHNEHRWYYHDKRRGWQIDVAPGLQCSPSSVNASARAKVTAKMDVIYSQQCDELNIKHVILGVRLTLF